MLIRTRTDRLLEFVQARPGCGIEDAARAVGMTRENTERLARILEENRLLETRYGLLGLTLRPAPKALVAKTSQKSEESRAALEARQLESEVHAASDLLNYMEKDLELRVARARTFLERLRKRQFEKDELDEVRREIHTALGQLAAFSFEISQLAKKEKRFLEDLTAFQRELERMNAAAEAPPKSLLARILDSFDRFKRRFQSHDSKKSVEPPSSDSVAFSALEPVLVQPLAKKTRTRRRRANDP